MKQVLVVLLFFLGSFVFSQDSEKPYLTTAIDINKVSQSDSSLIVSAIARYNEATTDTGKIKAIAYIVEESYDVKVYDAYNEVVFKLIDQSFPSAKGALKDSLKVWKGYAYYIRGMVATDLVQPEKALKSYEKALELLDGSQYQIVVGDTYGNLAIVYKGMGDLDKALKSIRKAISIRTLIEDDYGIANSFATLGNIYLLQNAYEEALENYYKALEINKKIQNVSSIASNYNNIAFIYDSYLKDYDKSKEYYLKSYYLFDSLGARISASSALANVASVYNDLKKTDSALIYFNEALELKQKANDFNGTSSIYLNLATIWFEKNKVNKAIFYAEKSREIAKKANKMSDLILVENNLAVYYKEAGRYLDAYNAMRRHYSLRDSIKNEENLRATMREEERRDFLMKSIADSVQYNKDLEISALEIEKSNAQLENKKKENALLYGGILIVVGLGIFTGVAYRRKRRDNRIISEQKTLVEQQRDEVSKQKEIIEEAHQEITDSINYAQRIQAAIMPPQKLVKEYLPGSFILYKPKDIVAGDFYWMEHTGNQILFAAADCTGHGVPGAMVSVVCNNGLNRSVREHGLKEPSRILDKTREIIISEFEKSEEEVKDGMDIALCSLEGSKLHYAGAHNPLWIIRKGAAEVEEIKADKQPIGKFGAEQPFTNHIVELQKGDTFYIFSDGFADQFGGEKGKKFKSKNFKKLLLSMQNQAMDRQRVLLDESFEKWKGNIEQLDDVCVIGVRI